VVDEETSLGLGSGASTVLNYDIRLAVAGPSRVVKL
jgi:hypothetical protein